MEVCIFLFLGLSLLGYLIFFFFYRKNKANKLLEDLRRKVVPTDSDIAMQKGEKFVESLITSYSIEEQSQVVLAVRGMLLARRDKEIKDTENHLNRLRMDRNKLNQENI
jgi:hypothetical protein